MNTDGSRERSCADPAGMKEGEMFSEARKAFEEGELEALGARMLELKHLPLQATSGR